LDEHQQNSPSANSQRSPLGDDTSVGSPGTVVASSDATFGRKQLAKVAAVDFTAARTRWMRQLASACLTSARSDLTVARSGRFDLCAQNCRRLRSWQRPPYVRRNKHCPAGAFQKRWISTCLMV
jgi:hypothetical protein